MRSLGVSFVVGLAAALFLGSVPMPAAAQQFEPMVSPPTRPMSPPSTQAMPRLASPLRPYQPFSPTIVLSPETAQAPIAANRPGYSMPYNSPNPYMMPYSNPGPYQAPNKPSDSYQSSYGDYGSSSYHTLYGQDGSYSSAPAAPAEAKRVVNVVIYDNHFQPARIEVPVGTTVEWKNAGQHIHSVTSDDNPWQYSMQLGPRDTYRRTFDAPGTYPYHCAMHSVAMRGVVVVK